MFMGGRFGLVYWPGICFSGMALRGLDWLLALLGWFSRVSNWLGVAWHGAFCLAVVIRRGCFRLHAFL